MWSRKFKLDVMQVIPAGLVLNKVNNLELRLMLALRGAGYQHSLAVSRWLPHRARTQPSCRRPFMQGLCDGFLDLAIALPLPSFLPPYSTTIILVTAGTRLALLPIAIWGKRRMRKIEEVVLPEIERLKPIVSKRVLEDMKQAGVRGDKKTLQAFHAKRSIEILKARRKQLFKEHKCRPLPSIILPPLSQLPPFVITTMALGRLSSDPTPFDSESFFTLATLAHPDPTMTLPIILGVLTMANVESGNWVMNAGERERARRIEEENAKRLAEGKVVVQPRKIIQNGLRILSVARIIVASLTPGSITLYWVTSAAFGLIQTWLMDWLDIRWMRRKAIANTTDSFSSTSRPPTHQT